MARATQDGQEASSGAVVLQSLLAARDKLAGGHARIDPVLPAGAAAGTAETGGGLSPPEGLVQDGGVASARSSGAAPAPPHTVA